jgi:hypothetical protein
VLLPGQLLTAGFLRRHEDLHVGQRERQEPQSLFFVANSRLFACPFNGRIAKASRLPRRDINNEKNA